VHERVDGTDRVEEVAVRRGEGGGERENDIAVSNIPTVQYSYLDEK